MFQPVELARRVGFNENAKHTQAGWPRVAARQCCNLTRRSVVPLTGLATTTKGAAGSLPLRPNHQPGSSPGRKWEVGRQGNGRGQEISDLTLSIFMADKPQGEFGSRPVGKLLDVNSQVGVGTVERRWAKEEKSGLGGTA